MRVNVLGTIKYMQSIFFVIIEVFVVCLSCLCISFVCYNFKVTNLTLYMYLFINGGGGPFFFSGGFVGKKS